MIDIFGIFNSKKENEEHGAVPQSQMQQAAQTDGAAQANPADLAESRVKSHQATPPSSTPVPPPMTLGELAATSAPSQAEITAPVTASAPIAPTPLTSSARSSSTNQVTPTKPTASDQSVSQSNQTLSPTDQANQTDNLAVQAEPMAVAQTAPAVTKPVITSKPIDPATQQKTYQGPKPTVLLVLDGWGIGPSSAGNAIYRAQTPNMDKYWLSYPHTQLEASGQAVGLPQGEDGNTETGHLNIGAGHIVYQDLPRINMSIADGSFGSNKAFLNAVNHVKQQKSVLHLMGLIGAGGVHSNIEHLYALLNFCKQQNVQKVYIHGFTDGRDSPPRSGINYVQQLMDHCQSTGLGELATLMGRYFAMDRDKRWERIEKAYNALTLGDGNQCIVDAVGAMKQQYDQGLTDEFIEPICICDQDGGHRTIKDNDAVIFFNYRIDRPRELTRAFVMGDFEQGITNIAFDPYTEKYEKTNIQTREKISTFQRQKVVNNLYFVTMTRYEDTLPTDVAFPPQFVKEPLGKVLANNGLRQLRITETEKERFVTYYMNGQQDGLFPGEERIICRSKGVKSYDEAPEMSAQEITDHMIQRINAGNTDVIISNICNGDMVGHTGNLDAAIKACEFADKMVGLIVETVLLQDGIVLITADHGNVEEMLNDKTGEVDTEHSVYPVPFIIIGKQFANKPIMLPSGILADVAPTMLHLMGLTKPNSMTGRALI